MPTLEALDTLFVGAFCGLIVGYAAGFFVARGIYRPPLWPL